MKEIIQKNFIGYFEQIVEMLPEIATALVVLILFFLSGWLAQKIFKRRMKKRNPDSLATSLGAQITKWCFWILGLFFFMHILGLSGVLTTLLAGAGISAIVMGFAFKDLAENLLAGLMLATNRPFKAGDIIQVDDNKGVVEEINLRSLHLRVVDGRDIYIPNSMVLKNVLTNFTRDGLLRLEFMVGLDTDCDFPQAREVVLETLRKDPQILQKPAPNLVVHEIGVSSLNVKVLFGVDQFASPPEPNEEGIVDPVKSRTIHAVRDALLAAGFALPGNILEHKMYQSENPLEIRVAQPE